MFVPSVADLKTSGPFSVIDTDTGATLYSLADAIDEPDSLPPESCCWPVLSVMARNDTLVIMTRPPKPDPRDVLRRTRDEYIRKQTANPAPGARRLW